MVDRDAPRGEEFGSQPQDIEAAATFWHALQSYNALGSGASMLVGLSVPETAFKGPDLEERLEMQGAILALEHSEALQGMGLEVSRDRDDEATFSIVYELDGKAVSHSGKVPQMVTRMESPERFSAFLARLRPEELDDNTRTAITDLTAVSMASLLGNELTNGVDMSSHAQSFRSIAIAAETLGDPHLAVGCHKIANYVEEGTGQLFALADSLDLMDSPNDEYSRIRNWHQEGDLDVISGLWNNAMHFLRASKEHPDARFHDDLLANMRRIIRAIEHDVQNPQPDTPPIADGVLEIIERVKRYIPSLGEG